jgi:CelD/BcsL family acetyltransferase involved in cellulose biosynthesis
MHARILHPNELTADDIHRWRAVQRADPDQSNPFLSAEFAQAVGMVRPHTRVAVVDVGGTRAFLPFERHRLGIGTAVGSGLSDCQGMVHEPGFACEPAALLRAAGLVVWKFDHLAPGAAPFAPGLFEGGTARLADSSVMDVGDGYDTYIKHLRTTSPAMLRKTLGRVARLEREVGEIRFVFDADDPGALDALMSWKSAQYRRTGRRDRFARPDIVGLVRSLTSVRAEHCTGTMSVLYVGGRPVACRLGLRSRTVLAQWFPAYDREFTRYAPGMILTLRMAEAAAAAGLEYVDLGKGDEPYKAKLATRTLSVGEGALALDTPVARLHLACDAALRRAEMAVLARPRLRELARRGLMQAGRLRTALGGRGTEADTRQPSSAGRASSSGRAREDQHI